MQTQPAYIGSGTTRPIWNQDADQPATRSLDRDIATEACIVGAGIAGLTTAYLLARAGKDVVVLDDGTIAGGETGRTSGHLASHIDDGYTEVERVRGEDSARLAYESHAAAIARIEQIVEDEGIDCDFTRLDAWLFAAPGQSPEVLDKEFDASYRAGMKIHKADSVPIPEFNVGRGLRMALQGQFHALKYMAGLAAAVERHGGRIFTRTLASQIKGGEPAHIQTQAGPVVRAGAVVVATNSPVNDMVTMHTKLAPYRTYVVGLAVPAGYVHPALYWDTDEPYHYARLQDVTLAGVRQTVLIVGGEDHKTGQAQDMPARCRRLEAWTRERWPRCGEVVFQWSGQVLETLDGLAYIGRNPGDESNVFIATGDSGMGLTHGTVAGMLLSDLVREQPNPWVELYDPSRKPVRAIRDYISENANVARQFVDYVTGGDVSSEEEIARGQGAILRRGASKVAVYRDQDGELHELGAVCPHAGCIVQWNPDEKTWDCPCHGSRFTVTGQQVNGPSYKGLSGWQEERAQDEK